MPPRAKPFPQTFWKRTRRSPNASDAVLRGRRAILRYPAIAHQAGYSVLRHEDPARVRVIPLHELPVDARLRFRRPAYDWRVARAIEEEAGRLGPDLDSVPDRWPYGFSFDV